MKIIDFVINWWLDLLEFIQPITYQLKLFPYKVLLTYQWITRDRMFKTGPAYDLNLSYWKLLKSTDRDIYMKKLLRRKNIG